MTDLVALQRIREVLPSTPISTEDVEALDEQLRLVIAEIEQLRAFRDGRYASARDILAESMKIGDLFGETAHQIACREIDAVAESLAAYHAYQTNEFGILNDRLTRRFDPAPAWNEAINRAITAKGQTRASMWNSPQQGAAFDFQQRATRETLRNA